MFLSVWICLALRVQYEAAHEGVLAASLIFIVGTLLKSFQYRSSVVDSCVT